MVTPTLAQVYFGVQGQGMASALLIVSPYQNLALSSFLGDKGNILHREQRTEFLWDCVQCEILPVTTESRRALQIYSKIYIFFTEFQPPREPFLAAGARSAAARMPSLGRRWYPAVEIGASSFCTDGQRFHHHPQREEGVSGKCFVSKKSPKTTQNWYCVGVPLCRDVLLTVKIHFWLR